MAKNGFLKNESRGLIPAAQEQALRANSVKHFIDRTSETPRCRLCGESTETVWHIASGCRKLALKEYRKRHEKVALQVPWKLCRKYGLECKDKWYDHQPLPVAKNREVRITWDMTSFTDQRLKHNRPGITVAHKNTQEWTIIDIDVPADQNIVITQEQKEEKYQDLQSWTKLLRKLHTWGTFFLTCVGDRFFPAPLPLEAVLLGLQKKARSLSICRKQL